MKKAPFMISIPEPCSQNYEDMQTVAGGRYCDSCQKTVHDFTLMSDAALLSFFQKNPGPHCGKLHESQLDRNIHTLPQKRNFFQKITTIAATIFAVLTSKSAAAQHAKPLQKSEFYFTEKKTSLHTSSITVSDSMHFKGIVIDRNNKPVIGAEVVLINGGDGYRVYSDSTGRFSIEVTGKLYIAATLSFTYYSFTKSDLINPTYIKSPEDLRIMLAGPKVPSLNISGRVGGIMSSLSVKVESQQMISTGPYSVWDTIRKLAH